MTNRRSRFLTVLFSFLPGAGHMYMGLMKMGVSLMSVFFLVIFLASFLNISLILYILPLVWFYSFFDCMNKMSLPDNLFAEQTDRYLFSLDTLFGDGRGFILKYRLYTGIGLVFIGACMIWNNFWPEFSAFFNERAQSFISSASRTLPQFVVSVIIIVIGAKLIAGKKKEDGHV